MCVCGRFRLISGQRVLAVGEVMVLGEIVAGIRRTRLHYMCAKTVFERVESFLIAGC